MEKETKHTPEDKPIRLPGHYRIKVSGVWHISLYKNGYWWPSFGTSVIPNGAYVDDDFEEINETAINPDSQLQTELSDCNQHQVEEGEHFVDWYMMRHHAAEREADRKVLSEMKKENHDYEVAQKGNLARLDELNEQVSEMKKEREELVQVLKLLTESKDIALSINKDTLNTADENAELILLLQKIKDLCEEYPQDQVGYFWNVNEVIDLTESALSRIKK